MGKLKKYEHNPGNTAVCYYRYSSDNQRDVSIDQQRKEAQKYCERKGYMIVKEYEDHALTGTDDNRPAFQQMLNEVQRLRPAYLILWKSDRLARNRELAAIVKGHLRKSGVRWEYVAQTTPDEDDPTSIIVDALYEAFDEWYSYNLMQNVMRGLNDNASKALYNGVPVLGYIGKRNHQYEIDDKTAPIVQKIFKDYASGMPMQKIINSLNDGGIKTGKGNNFTINSIRAILHNRSYIGEYSWGEHTIPDGMPRIISDELFEQAQSQLAKNKRGGGQAERKLDANTSADYWLTGHLFCGCGAAMQGVSGTSRHGYKCYYYSCSDHRKKKCNMKNKRKDAIEDIVIYVLNDLLNNPALQIILADHCYNYYKSEHGDSNKYITALAASIMETEKRYDNIVKAIEDGAYTKKMAERMQDLESQLNMLNDELEAEKIRQKNEITMNDILRYLHSFVGDISKPENRDKLLNLLVDKIYIYDDEMTITFTYTDDKQTFVYEDMKKLLDARKTIEEMLHCKSAPESAILHTEKNLERDPNFF